MKLILDRCWLSAKSTVGKLRIDDVFECYTLEDRYRPPPEEKVPGQTCIPVGTYDVQITYSPRFKTLMPAILDVPGFKGVRIHTGNKPEDTEGCIIVGKGRGVGALINSREAYVALFQKLQAAQLRGERMTIDVRLSPHEGVSTP